MHPILAHKGRLVLYLTAWVPIAFLLAALLAYSGNVAWKEALALAGPLAYIYAFLCLSSWYVCRAFPLHQTPVLQLIGIHLLAASLSASFWVLVGKGWTSVLSAIPGWSHGGTGYVGQGPVLLGSGVLLFSFATSIHYLVSTFESSRDTERRSFELQILAREAELKALRAQIDPHFLFNCLNSISALTTVNPAGARKMCLLLSTFLRKSLELGAERLISLSEEISLKLSYLEVEQVRLGSRLSIDNRIQPESERCRVPPLIVQPLVENAVHHGIAHLVDGGRITIETRVTGERLRIVVTNPCDPERPAGRGNGIGQENVRHRLLAVYGLDARLKVENAPDFYRAEISLPAQMNERAADAVIERKVKP